MKKQRLSVRKLKKMQHGKRSLVVCPKKLLSLKLHFSVKLLKMIKLKNRKIKSEMSAGKRER